MLRRRHAAASRSSPGRIGHASVSGPIELRSAVAWRNGGRGSAAGRAPAPAAAVRVAVRAGGGEQLLGVGPAGVGLVESREHPGQFADALVLAEGPDAA